MIKKFPRQPVEYVEVECGPGYVPIYLPSAKRHGAQAAAGGWRDNRGHPRHPLMGSPDLDAHSPDVENTDRAWLFVPADVSVVDAIASLNKLPRIP